MAIRYKDSVLPIRDHIRDKIWATQDIAGSLETKEILISSLNQTILRGDSDSTIICGPIGSGKVALVNHVVSEIGSKHMGKFKLVTIEGEVLAADLSKIKSRNISCCSRSSVLCRYNCIIELQSEGTPAPKFSQNFMNIAALVSAPLVDRLPVVIVIYRFDCFCNSSSQSLLYSLFDMTQMAPTPTCILATTTRYDIPELFEKRVKSRFSHKVIKLVPNKNISVRLDNIKSVLKFSPKKKSKLYKREKVYQWNKAVEEFLKCPKIKKQFSAQLECSLSDIMLRKTLFLILNRVTHSNPYPNKDAVLKVFHILFTDPVVISLKSLSTLSIALMICALKYVENTGADVMTQTSVEELFFNKLRTTSFMVPSELSMRKAFRDIVSSGFFYNVGPGTAGNYKFIVTRDQLETGLLYVEHFPTALKQWIIRG